MVELLASLADAAGNFQHDELIATIEDNDSVLSQVLPSEDGAIDVDAESIDMSQRVWNDDDQQQQQQNAIASVA